MFTKLSLALMAAFATAQQELIVEERLRELSIQDGTTSFEATILDGERRLSLGNNDVRGLDDDSVDEESVDSSDEDVVEVVALADGVDEESVDSESEESVDSSNEDARRLSDDSVDSSDEDVVEVVALADSVDEESVDSESDAARRLSDDSESEESVDSESEESVDSESEESDDAAALMIVDEIVREIVEVNPEGSDIFDTIVIGGN